MTERKRAAAAQARRPRAAAKTVEADDEDDEEGDDESMATYDPKEYALLPHSVLQTLLAGQQAATGITHKLVEAQFIGVQGSLTSQGEQLTVQFSRVNELQTQVGALHTEIHERNMKIADMERQSEEARLAREHLQASMRNGQLELEKTRMEHEADLMRLREVLKGAKPLIDGGTMAFMSMMNDKFGSKVPTGAGPGLPGAPGAAVPTGTRGPEYKVSLDEIQEFHALVHNGWTKLTPESAGMIRALIASGFSQSPNGPKLPLDVVMGQLVNDLGPEFVMPFMTLIKKAWIEVPPADATGAQAPN